MTDLRAHFCRMAGNNLWSNDRLHRAVGLLKPGEFDAPRTSFFPSIAETLNHILSIDLYYVDMIEEGGAGLGIFDRYVPHREPAGLFAAQQACDRRLLALCERLTPTDIDRRVDSDRGDDGMVPERIGDLLAHLFLHQIHHRGQVHAMLSGTSVPPPQLDEFLLDFDRDRRRLEEKRLGLEGRSA